MYILKREEKERCSNKNNKIQYFVYLFPLTELSQFIHISLEKSLFIITLNLARNEIDNYNNTY